MLGGIIWKEFSRAMFTQDTHHFLGCFGHLVTLTYDKNWHKNSRKKIKTNLRFSTTFCSRVRSQGQQDQQPGQQPGLMAWPYTRI